MEDIFEYKDCISPIEKIQSINVYGVNKENGHVPFFTIAIPTYKRVSTLRETLESVLSQKEFDDYNVIVVDNNPERNDETELFMSQYKYHPKVTYYKHEENVGMAGNFNKCLMLPTSNNVIMVHDDDVTSPYCLKTFSKLLGVLPSDWAMVKPNLASFSDIKDISFQKPSAVYYNKLHRYNFYNECAVGAPTNILFNRSVILAKGGYNQVFFPSYDYAMTCRCVMENSIYSLSTNSPIGGYRIACNESLSPNTMNKYFEKRYNYGKQLMRVNGWKSVLIKIFQSLCYKDDMAEICRYYNMPSFLPDTSSLDVYKLPDFVCHLFRKMYRKTLGYIKRIERYKL